MCFVGRIITHLVTHTLLLLFKKAKSNPRCTFFFSLIYIYIYIYIKSLKLINQIMKKMAQTIYYINTILEVLFQTYQSLQVIVIFELSCDVHLVHILCTDVYLVHLIILIELIIQLKTLFLRFCTTNNFFVYISKVANKDNLPLLQFLSQLSKLCIFIKHKRII